MKQPFGLIRFYSNLFQRVSKSEDRETPVSRFPTLWDISNKLPQFQAFTTTVYVTLYKFELYCEYDDTLKYDLAPNIPDVERILCDAQNTEFYAWVYRTETLSQSIDDGHYYIKLTFRDAFSNEIYLYSNSFLIET